MPWFKTVNNKILRVMGGHGGAALGFGVDAAGKEIVIGRQADLTADSNFADGSVSHYGSGSIVFLTAGGSKQVDVDGYWQTATLSTASPSASPSHSVSPSHSGSPSTSPSTSPSHSGSPSVSPSGSASPSHSASPST